jgi:acyl carrier protein
MPLLSNGKINRKQLPAAEFEQAQYKAPQTRTEQVLADIWQEVLGVERVGLLDNFFELGGHSLLATRVVAKVRHELSVNMPLRSVFEFTSLEEMAAFISTVKRMEEKDTESDDDLEEIDL